MPGRGRPWRGVGEGNPDRIGTGAIADGSITESDLNTDLQDKVNSGGGATNDIAFIQDEFVYHDVQAETVIEGKYELENGVLTFNSGALYGVLEINSGSVSTEGAGELSTINTFEVDPNKGNSEFQMVVIPESLQQFHAGTLTNSDFGSVVDVASIGAENLYGFIMDPAINTNWQAMSRRDDVDTIVDTGVAVVAGTRVSLVANHDFNAGNITYTINGNVVATISTNIPNEELFLDAYSGNVVATQRSLFIDFWQASGDRVD